MNINRYDSEAVFAELRHEWDDLLADSTADRVFMSHEWHLAWWQAYQPGAIWVLAVRDADTGQLVGIAPWFVAVGDDGQRVIHPIGCVDVTDYLEVIARQGHEDAVFGALASYLAAHVAEFDAACLCNIPEQSPTCRLFPARLAEQGFEVTAEIEDVCPVVRLPEQWEDYIAALDKKNRHELRRKLRRAGGDPAPVAWYIVGPEHNLDEELARFVDLMAKSSPDKARFLQDARNRAFFEIMVPVMARQGWLQLAFLTVQGDAAAAYLNFDDGERVLVYNSGHDPGAHGHLSPGIVLLARLIEHAIGQRRQTFDFLRGNEPYKYDMGGRDTTIHRLVITPPSKE